jgi:uncharacterized membrane protein YGL010W
MDLRLMSMRHFTGAAPWIPDNYLCGNWFMLCALHTLQPGGDMNGMADSTAPVTVTVTPTVTDTATPTASVGERHIDRLLARYADSHRHRSNEVIHFICVPAIVWSVIGMLWSTHPLLAIAGVAVAQVYYFRLSAPFCFGMLAMTVLFLASFALLPPGRVLPLAIGVFVVAWIGQFIGHKIEGKKPSFFDDLRFLLIGPLFVLGFLYRRLHVRY